MADSEKQDKVFNEDEEARLIEKVAVLDFDMLCSTVVMQNQTKWTRLHTQNHEDEDEIGAEFGGVLRMWENDLLDCFEDRRIVLQSAFCPCYRFGKNMRRAGFGASFLQGIIYLVIASCALLNLLAFAVTKKNCFLYMGVAFTISIAAYLGFYRTNIRKKFNIKGSDSSLDDFVNHLVCPCCTLSQESRTLEMNNVQDGIWHGRGDTLCIGTYNESSKTFFELRPPPLIPPKSPEPCLVQQSLSLDSTSL
jgi:Cys-rich protein (TIGR01571 family)